MIKSVQNEAVLSSWLTSRDALPGAKFGLDGGPPFGEVIRARTANFINLTGQRA
jgi:hypothetical protein